MDLIKRSPLTPELLAEIRRLHFHTRHLAEQGIVGQYRSAFRGQGMEFEEVREYSPGDDVRAIDWKVTARSRKPFIKLYNEERELTVMIAVDVSASGLTGTKNTLRERLIAQVGAVLTLIALRNNDKVGLLTYSDKVETFHPPRKGRTAVWTILHEVLAPSSNSPRTDLKGMFAFLNRVLKRNAITFVLSDFIDSGFEQEMAIFARRHDLTAITVSDPADFTLPRAGLVELRNPETGERNLLDTSSDAVRSAYEAEAKTQRDNLKRCFARSKVNQIALSTDRPFVPELRQYFETRKLRAH